MPGVGQAGKSSRHTRRIVQLLQRIHLSPCKMDGDSLLRGCSNERWLARPVWSRAAVAALWETPSSGACCRQALLTTNAQRQAPSPARARAAHVLTFQETRCNRSARSNGCSNAGHRGSRRIEWPTQRVDPWACRRWRACRMRPHWSSQHCSAFLRIERVRQFIYSRPQHQRGAWSGRCSCAALPPATCCGAELLLAGC